MSGHTKEPWRISPHKPTLIEGVGELGGDGYDNAVANNARAAECVTAMAGAESPALVREAAVAALAYYFNEQFDFDEFNELMRDLRDAMGLT